MKRAFIIHTDIESVDPASLIAVAEDIADAVEGKGILVDSVVPWAMPGTTNPIPSAEAFSEPPPIPLA